MSTPLPALNPDHLARLQTLTRDYARLSRRGAGWGKVLAGGFLVLLAGLDWHGHRGQIALLGRFAPLPGRTVLALGLLPFLWLGAREALGRDWERRHGAVAAAPAPMHPRRRRLLEFARWILPALVLLTLVPVLTRPMSLRGFRIGAVLVLALTLARVWTRLAASDRIERLTGLLLFFGPALLLSGWQLSAGDTLLAFPAIGLVAVLIGLREQWSFHRLARQLAGSR